VKVVRVRRRRLEESISANWYHDLRK